jgi:hypothetical protein
MQETKRRSLAKYYYIYILYVYIYTHKNYRSNYYAIRLWLCSPFGPWPLFQFLKPYKFLQISPYFLQDLKPSWRIYSYVPFSGDQPCQCWVRNQRFGDLLCLHRQSQCGECQRESQIHVTTDDQSALLDVEPHLGLMNRFSFLSGSYGFVAVRHSLGREDRSVNYKGHGQLHILSTKIFYVWSVHIPSLVNSPSHCESYVHTIYRFSSTVHVSIHYTYVYRA